MLLRDIGEAGLIRKLLAAFGQARPGILKAIGDDAAVTRVDDARSLLTTTDTLVEGVHFDTSYAPARTLGRKLVSVSLSDIAAMGGTPLYLLVSLCLPQETGEEFFDALYAGVRDRTEEFGVALIGGNTSASKAGIVLTSTLIGEAETAKVVYRNGAGAGEAIYATGTLGDSALGLRLFREAGGGPLPKGYEKAAERHLDPSPRVYAGKALSERGIATSMIDVSDGLVCDIKHLAAESGLGAEIEFERIPVSEALRDFMERHPESRSLPLAGGEDYELLFTVGAGKAGEIKALERELGLTMTQIGFTVPSPAVTVTMDGAPLELEREGYEHFRNG